VRGSIIRRGKNSWRIKLDVPNAGAGRKTVYVTVRGTKKDADRERIRLAASAHDGTLVEPSRITVADYLRSWLSGAHGLARKTHERYLQLANAQVIPHLGHLALQALRPAHIDRWHSVLLTSGGKDGRPLSPRTVGHAHRVLHRALERAVKSELVARNVAHAIEPPKVEDVEVESLKADQIAPVLEALKDHWLEPIAVLALSIGARRGEVLGLPWECVDLSAATIRIERSLEQTKAGLYFKPPKSKRGRRTVALPPIAVETLQTHRRRQLEQRLAFGLGKPDEETLVFSSVDGSPIPPNNLSRDWRRFVRAKKLPPVSFHALRHSHASALIASGIDPATVSRRIGHANVSTTLNIYSHQFAETDAAAAKAIEATLKR